MAGHSERAAVARPQEVSSGLCRGADTSGKVLCPEE